MWVTFIMLLKFLTSSLITLFVLEKFLVVADSEDNLTFIQLFQKGVEAYKAEKWLTCINNFGRGMEDYKKFKTEIAGCRKTCHALDLEAKYTTDVTDVENRFYEKTIIHTLCLVRCKAAHFGGRETKFAPDVEDAYELLVPYDYLQMCYFKAGHVDKALTAAYTFLHRNPGHENMQHNVKFYLSKLSGETDKYLRNSEPKPYQDLFLQGVEAYDKKSYQSVMDVMERSLEAFFQEEDDLRSMCEGPFDQDRLQPDLYIALANHMTYALKCRQRCKNKLQTFDGFAGGSLLSKYFFYLQEAYEKLDQPEESLAAAASFLLLNPKDEAMLKKKDELLDQSGSEPEWFAPRKDALKYFKRDETERILLENLEADFKVLIDETKEREFKDGLRSLVGLKPPGEESKVTTLKLTAEGNAVGDENELKDKKEDAAF